MKANLLSRAATAVGLHAQLVETVTAHNVYEEETVSIYLPFLSFSGSFGLT